MFESLCSEHLSILDIGQIQVPQMQSIYIPPNNGQWVEHKSRDSGSKLDPHLKIIHVHLIVYCAINSR